MNKEFYDYGTLVDFKGEEHHIIVCVVFRPFKQTVFKDGVEILQGVISIGVSICNPMDTFDVHLGEQIAYNKALKPNTPALYTNTKGIVTDNLLSTLADQEVEYVINNTAATAAPAFIPIIPVSAKLVICIITVSLVDSLVLFN